MSATKCVAAALVAATIGIAGCGTGSSSSSHTATGGGGANNFQIDALTSVPFTQMTDMMNGFKSGAAGCGLDEGKNVHYRVDDAQGDQSTLQLLAKNNVANKASLFVALDTPGMITLASQTHSIPIVGIAPSYPVQAGVAKSLAHPAGNVTGGTDTIDPAVTVDQVLAVLPNLKRLGMVYNAAEQNSVQFQQSIAPVLTTRGVKLVQVSVTGTGEIQTAVRGLAGRVDAILIGHDNTMISAAKTVISLAASNKIPVASSISGVAAQGAIFDLGVSYNYLGQKAGAQACQILLHGVNPGDLPFTTIQSPIVSVNPSAAAAFGIQIPASVLKTATTLSTTK